MADDQMNMLQDMVAEMKDGFQSALQELAKIQDKEEGEANHSKKLQQQQQRQLDDLTETIHDIKNQLVSLSKTMEHLKDEQRSMKDSLEEVRSNRGSSQDSKPRSDGDRPDLLDDFSAPPEEWNTKLSDLPSMDDNQEMNSLPNGLDNDVTALACKSLSLTQALGDKCLNLNLSESSDDDLQAETRRVSHYAPKTAQLVFDELGNRRHSSPAQAGSSVKSRDISNAAVQRQKAVKQLADSERDYCSKLWSLLHTYLTPLQTAGFLSARELGVLFPPYLDQLYAEHCHICTGLQDRLVHWTYMGTVADLLARVTDSHNSDSMMSLYKEYAEDLPSAVTCLRKAVAQSAEFRNFLKAIKHSSCESQDLMSLILCPVQHIPRYLLQLQQVARHTPPTHPDYPLLKTSLHRLRIFVDQLNEEVSNTIGVLSQDGSNLDNGQVLSARDSGVHSNSTEEDNISSARAFSRGDGNHVLSEWLDGSYYDSHHLPVEDVSMRQRQLRSSGPRMGTLSQPDLTIYKNMTHLSSDPRLAAHIPRSQSSLPAAGADDDGGNILRGRQHRKYKVKKRHQSPVGYSSHDHIQQNLSPRVRPSSAIDFLSHSHHHPLHQNYRDPPMFARGYQYPGPQPRPHSALGPHVMDTQHKPTIISRKMLRRSQPPMPTSRRDWPLNTSGAVSGPPHMGHLRSPHDLLPTRPSPHHTADLIDDYDEEDDTRASDTHSLGTSGSHHPSSSHCSNEGHELDLDLYPGHFGSQSPRNGGLRSDPSTEFSAAEVTANLARKLCTDQILPGKDEDVVTRHQENDISKAQKHQTGEAKSVSGIRAGDNMTEIHDISGRENMSQIQVQNGSHTYPSPKHENVNGDDNADTLTSSSGVSTNRPSSHSNLINAIRNSAKSETSMDGDVEVPDSLTNKTDEAKHKSEHNRQFLLSLANRSSTRSSPNHMGSEEDNNSFFHSKIETQSGNLPHVNETNGPDSSSDTFKNISSMNTSDASINLSKSSAARKEVNHNHEAMSSTAINESHGVLNSEPAHACHSLSQPLPLGGNSGNSDESKIPSEPNQAVSQSRNYHKNWPRVLSAGSVPQNRSTSLDEPQHPSSRPNPFITSPTKSSGNQSMLGQPLETAIDTPRDEKSPTRVHPSGLTHKRVDSLSTYPDHNELPPLEVADLVAEENGKEEVRRREGRKKAKDERKSYPSDNLPKTSEDAVSARKKMHFKASIKNLFTKKKGRVILADVEREVVMEMATAAAAATTNTTSTKLPSPTSPKLLFSKSKKMGHETAHPEQVTPEKNFEDSAFEIRTRKDQGSSTSSPMKVSHRFRIQTKLDKQHQPGRDSDKQQQFCRDNPDVTKASTDLVQKSNTAETSSEQTKAGRKRYGMVLENVDVSVGCQSDAQGGNNQALKSLASNEGLYVGDDQAKAKSGTNHRMFLSPRYLADTPLPVQVTEKGTKSQDSTTNSDVKLMLKNWRKQLSNQKDAEVEVLPSSDSRSKNKNKSDKPGKHNKDVTDDQKVSANLDSNLQVIKTHQDKSRNEKSRKGQKVKHGQSTSPLSSVELCQRCQKGETRPMEKVHSGNLSKHSDNIDHLSSCKACNDVEHRKKTGLADNSRSASDSKYSSKSVMSNKTSASSTIQRNILHNDLSDEKKVSMTDKVVKVTCLDDQDSSSVARCLQPCADVILLFESSRNATMINSYPLPTSSNNGRRKADRPRDKCKSSMLSPVSEQDDNPRYSWSPSYHNTNNGEHLENKYPQKVFNIKDAGLSQDSKAETKFNQLSLSHDKQERESHLSQENKDAGVMDDQDQTLVKTCALVDKDYFNHRYRLYYDDEGDSQNKRRAPEISKSSSGDRNTETSREAVNGDAHHSNSAKDHKYSDPIRDKFLQTPQSNDQNSMRSGNDHTNNDSSTQRFTTSFSSSTGTTCSLTDSNGRPCDSPSTAPSPSQFLWKLPPYRLCFTKTSDPNEDGQFVRHGCQSPSSRDVNEKKVSASKGGAHSENMMDKSDQTNTKSLYVPTSQTSAAQERNRWSASDVWRLREDLQHDSPNRSVNASFDKDHCSFDYAVAIDESSSYKPKNSQVAPHTLVKSQCLSGEERLHERDSSMNGHTSPQPRLVSPLHMGSRKHDFKGTKSQGHRSVLHFPRSNKNGLVSPSPVNLAPDSQIHQPQRLSPFQEGSQGFLRASSPYGFFSVLPYKDYVLQNNSSDSGTLMLSDAESRSTPTSAKSASKSSSDKQDRSRRKESSKKGKKSCDRNSLNTSADGFSGSHCIDYDHKLKLPVYPRRQQSDGIVLRANESNFHPLPHPRYSLESNPLIADSFLQRMAYLPQYSYRPLSHPHVDGSHIHHSSHTGRHATAHAELTRKLQHQNMLDGASGANSHVSRSIKNAACSTGNSPVVSSVSSTPIPSGDPCRIASDDQQSMDNRDQKLSTLDHASPDLLPSNAAKRDEASPKDKSSSVKKAQSFFSRLTQSPMSFFTRDSKSSSQPK